MVTAGRSLSLRWILLIGVSLAKAGPAGIAGIKHLSPGDWALERLRAPAGGGVEDVAAGPSLFLGGLGGVLGQLSTA